MRILVVGAYGLIGRYVAARLTREGHAVVGAGRDIAAARRQSPDMTWVLADLSAMYPRDWAPLLVGVDAVVNAAGALQDGPRDNLFDVHVRGIRALADACVVAGVRRFVQISAVDVESGGSDFNRTKSEGDATVRSLDLDWLILRPGLVLAPAAYGGSALLRGLAAFPLAIPLVHADAVVQVASIDDVARAVAIAVRIDAPARITVDIASAEPTTLLDIVVALRAWLGLKPAFVLALPTQLAGVGSWVADLLSWLGWRSPLRSTAISQLAARVRGEAGDAARYLGFEPRRLNSILADWPCGVQERWFARLYFVKPLGLASLAGFWVASGLIGLARQDTAISVLTHVGMAATIARTLVIGGAATDITLGLLTCHRRTASFALGGMIAVSGAYLAGATLWRPDLWADPMGPLTKVIPAAILALAVLTLMEER